MEERELTQLLQQLGDRVTPSPAPVRRILDAGEALGGRRSGRVRMFAVAAAAAAVVGGGAVAATVIDLPSGSTMSADSGGEAASGGDDSGAGAESAPRAESGSSGSDEGTAAADAAGVVVTPAAAGPGTVVRLEVPPDVRFGDEWTLERSVDGAWKPTFVLVDADAAAEKGTALSRPVGESTTLPGLTKVNVDPVPLVLPDAVTPGKYRICQLGDDGTDWCGGLTVTG